MRTTFSGLGLALGLAVMVVFMIMASQFKSLRLPFVMLFTIPVSLVGIVLALMAAGKGFSITALMGILMVIGIAVSNGILLVDDANTRLREGKEKAVAIVEAARSRFVPIVMTSLATVIGLIPTAMGLEQRLGGEPAARARRRRGAHVVDVPLALPRAGDVRSVCEGASRQGRGGRRERPSGGRRTGPRRVKPPYLPNLATAILRISFFWIFPMVVFGSALTNSTNFGVLYFARFDWQCSMISADVISTPDLGTI